MFVVLKNRLVQVYETDMMGIVHHSNYIRFFEETRVRWFIDQGLLDHSLQSVSQLTVLNVQAQYLIPLKYGDVIDIEMQIRSEGARVFIQYRIYNQYQKICTVGQTVHCALDQELKPIRLRKEFVQKIKETQWTETWL